jgi:predicted neuraminidase
MKIFDSRKEYIYKEDREFQSCHASTLICLDNGDILAAWFGGSWGKSPDVCIWMSRRTPVEWQEPFKVAGTWGISLWNPVLFHRADGKFFFITKKEGKIIPQWRTMVKHSDDGGKTWCCAYQSELPNNNSSIDLAKLLSSDIILAYNPEMNLSNHYRGPRAPLVLSYSEDDGDHWECTFALEDSEGEYSYPAIIAKKDKIFLTYTGQRQKNCFLAVRL